MAPSTWVILSDKRGDNGQVETIVDALPWPVEADGNGYSLVLIAPDAGLDPDDPSSWRSSTLPGGNPNETDALPLPANCPSNCCS